MSTEQVTGVVVGLDVNNSFVVPVTNPEGFNSRLLKLVLE